MWDADGDGVCVGDGSVMDVRIKNERERESIFISISHVQKTAGQTSLYLRAPRASQPVVEQWVMCTLCSDETAV